MSTTIGWHDQAMRVLVLSSTLQYPVAPMADSHKYVAYSDSNLKKTSCFFTASAVTLLYMILG